VSVHKRHTAESTIDYSISCTAIDSYYNSKSALALS